MLGLAFYNSNVGLNNNNFGPIFTVLDISSEISDHLGYKRLLYLATMYVNKYNV